MEGMGPRQSKSNLTKDRGAVTEWDRMLTPRQEMTKKGLTLKMRPLLVGEPRERPPRKWTHHRSTSTAAVAASARATFAGAGTAISSSGGGGGDRNSEVSRRPGPAVFATSVNRLYPASSKGPEKMVSPAHSTSL